jgi:hypothetical protein
MDQILTLLAVHEALRNQHQHLEETIGRLVALMQSLPEGKVLDGLLDDNSASDDDFLEKMNDLLGEVRFSLHYHLPSVCRVVEARQPVREESGRVAQRRNDMRRFYPLSKKKLIPNLAERDYSPILSTVRNQVMGSGFSVDWRGPALSGILRNQDT